jgi:hypothetical protein
MARIDGVAAPGLLAFMPMALLTELVSINEDCYYRRGAPSGAVSTRQYCNPAKRAKDHPKQAKGQNRR